MSSIADTAKIFKNVNLGENVIIEDFTVIGVPPKGKKNGELQTVIGDNAHIRSHTVIYAGAIIGNNFQTGNHASIREDSIIGDNVSVGAKAVVEFKTKLGDNVRIQTSTQIAEYCEVHEGCMIGPFVSFTNAKYPNAPRSKEFLQGVVVEKNAVIGASTTILPGVKIGTHSLVGAGSVVTKDVPPGKVVVGNPAKVINDVKDLKFPTGETVYEEK